MEWRSAAASRRKIFAANIPVSGIFFAHDFPGRRLGLQAAKDLQTREDQPEMTTHGTTNPTLKVLANTDAQGLDTCSGGGCPTVYEIDDDTIAVQGYVVDGLFEAGFIPAGENVVRIPKGLLRQLAANHPEI